MHEWRLRDTVLVIFMVNVIVVMLMQMIQNDRLYERVNRMISVVERNAAGGGAGLGTATRTDGAGWRVPDGEPGGTIVVCYGEQPHQLNPVTSSDAYSDIILMGGGSHTSCVYETLLERDSQTLELVGLLAERWDVSNDKLCVTFTLRPDVHWADGEPITADDVVFSARLMKLPQLDAQQSQVYFVDLDRVEAVDARTVSFHWKNPYFKSIEVSGTLVPILPRHVHDPDNHLDSDPIALAKEMNQWNGEWRGRMPISSGPYQVESWDRPGQRIVLRRNDAYWGPRAMVERYMFRFISNDEAALQTLKKGEIDAMWLTPEQWTKQTGAPEFLDRFVKLKYRRADAGFSFIGWNNRRSPFDDKRVRQAMSCCVPRERINERLNYGLSELQNGPFYMDGPQASPKVGQWPYDPERARALLAEAGFRDSDGDGILDRDGRAFDFAMRIPSGGRTQEQIAAVVQDELRKIGVRMSIEPYEWTVYIEKLNQRDFEACMLGWTGTLDNDPFQIWHSSSFEKRGSNFIGYNNPQVDRLIVEARVEFDADKRNALYHRMHEILFDEQPYTFLFTGSSLLAYKRSIHDVQPYRIGTDFREWWIPRDLQAAMP